MNTADQKGSVIGLAVPGKFLPQPGGAQTAASLAEYVGVYSGFYAGAAPAVVVPTPFAGISAALHVTHLRRFS